MAKEEIQIKIDAAVESAEAAKSLGQLRKSLIEIQTLQAEIGDTSGAQFDKLSQASASASAKLAETRDRIGDIQDKTRTLEGTTIERLTGSFGLLKESIMNLDFDKAKIGAEGLLNTFTPVVDGKLVTGLAGVKGAFGMLADGVKSLGSTFMSVGKALLTNPIFLLAAAIIAIVAVVVLIMDKLGLLKKIMDALGAAIDVVVKAFESLTDWLGLTTNAQEEAAASAKKLGETQRAEIDETAKKQQQHLKDIQGMTNDEIAEYKKKAGIKDNLNKSSFDIEKERLTQTQETLKVEIDALEELKAAGGELTDEQVKDLEQRKKDYKSNANAIVSIEEQKVKAIMDANKKISDTLRDWQIKNIKDENERNKEQSKVEEARKITEVDVQIAQQALLTGAASKEVKDLELLKTQIHQYYSTQRTTINEVEHKKAVETNKNAVQKKLEEEEKKKQLLIISLENQRELKLKAENLTGDDIIAINNEYDEKVLEQTKKNEDALYKFKKDNAILTGKSLQIERERLNDVQAARQKAFDEGELKNFNDRRKAQVDKELSDLQVQLAEKLSVEGLSFDERLKIQQGYDDTLFKARRSQIITDAEIELADAKKTEDEKAIIRNNAFLEIVALEEELKARKAGYVTKDLEDKQLIADTAVSNTEFEIEQYNKKIQGISLLAQGQKDRLIQLNADEKLAIKSAMDLELSDTELSEAQKAAIKEKYRQLNEEQEQAAQERLRQLKFKELAEVAEYAEKGLKSVGEISDAAFAWKQRNLNKETEALMKNLKTGTKEYDIANAKKFKMEQDLAKKMFNTNKALQLSGAVIDGFKAITTSLAMAPVAIGPVPNPAGIASLAFAAITTAANIAKIAASKFQEGTPPAPTVASPDLGGGAGAGSEAAPTNFNPNQFFGLGQTTANGMPGGQKPIKVYVTETDIRDVGTRVSVIEQRAIY